MTFWSCRKKDSIRKIRLISKSMRSQPPKKKTIATHLFPNMSRSKDMLITYVNNVSHVNYVNNIYNNLINKSHLNLKEQSNI